MKARRFLELVAYVNHLAQLVELRDWKITLDPGPPPRPGVAGSIEPTFGRKCARMWLSPEWPKWTEEEKRHVIVHELLHCHLEHAKEQVRCDLENHLPNSADNIFWLSYKRSMEYGVDGIATALARHLPTFADYRKRS